MAKITKRLLPIKAHFLFFMAAMGPILPQLSVLGKDIGIEPEVMGYITSVLPIMYVIAKPVFGFVADYFVTFRKGIFMGLIAMMTLAFAGFYFIPQVQLEPSATELQITLNVTKCTEELLATTGGIAGNCTDDGERYTIAFFTDPELVPICVASNMTFSNYSATCEFSRDAPPLSIYSTSNFWLFVLLMFVGTIGFNVANSISDAICFDMLGDAEADKYGAQRVWGTIGFGLTALLAGIVVNVWTVETAKSFTPALIIMLVFSVCDMFSVSKLQLPKLTSSESIFKDVWGLVSHPSIVAFMMFAVIAGILDSFIIYFMFWHLEEVAAETGYMDQIKLIEGCVVAAECLAGEVPFFFYSGKIIKRLGYVHCMSMCFFFYAIRLALIAWIPNPWWLVGVEFFFQGCTYAVAYSCIVAYASAVAPPGTSATVQGLMAGMDDGLGFSIGSLIGGLAFKRFGGRRSFIYFSIAAACTCVAHIVIRPSSRKQQYLPKTGYQLPAQQISVAAEKVELAT